MSGKLAYRLAVILMLSPVVIVPLFVIWNMHRQYVARQQFEVLKAEMIADLKERGDEARLRHQQ